MRFLMIVCVIFFVSCTAAGGIKPTVYTAPPSYLKTFPLGQITEKEMIMKAGPPNRTIEIDGKKAFVYDLGEVMGARSFTYIFENGVVDDVLYNDMGQYNGITAKQYQGK
ncbi:MAG: hypothetical protein ABIL58_20150 [Pseudomonadota bacterium]